MAKAMLGLNLGLSDDEDDADKKRNRPRGKTKKHTKDEGIADLLSSKDSMTMFGGTSRRNSGFSSKPGGDMLSGLMGGDPLDLLSREVSQRGEKDLAPEEDADEEELRFRRELEKEMGLAGVAESDTADVTTTNQKDVAADKAELPAKSRELDVSNGSLDDIMGDILDDMDDKPATHNKPNKRATESRVRDDIMGDILADMDDKPANKHPGRSEIPNKRADDESRVQEQEADIGRLDSTATSGNPPIDVELKLDAKPKRRLGKAKAKPSPAPSDPSASLSENRPDQNDMSSFQASSFGEAQADERDSNSIVADSSKASYSHEVGPTGKKSSNDLDHDCPKANTDLDTAQDNEDWSDFDAASDFDAESPKASSMPEETVNSENDSKDLHRDAPEATHGLNNTSAAADKAELAVKTRDLDASNGSLDDIMGDILDDMDDKPGKRTKDPGRSEIPNKRANDESRVQEQEHSEQGEPPIRKQGADNTDELRDDSPKVKPTAVASREGQDMSIQHDLSSSVASPKRDKDDLDHNSPKAFDTAPDNEDWSNDFDADSDFDAESPKDNSLIDKTQNGEDDSNHPSHESTEAMTKIPQEGILHDPDSLQQSTRLAKAPDVEECSEECGADISKTSDKSNPIHHDLSSPGVSEKLANSCDEHDSKDIVANSLKANSISAESQHGNNDTSNHHDNVSSKVSIDVDAADDDDGGSNSFDDDSPKANSVVAETHNGEGIVGEGNANLHDPSSPTASAKPHEDCNDEHYPKDSDADNPEVGSLAADNQHSKDDANRDANCSNEVGTEPINDQNNEEHSPNVDSVAAEVEHVNDTSNHDEYGSPKVSIDVAAADEDEDYSNSFDDSPKANSAASETKNGDPNDLGADSPEAGSLAADNQGNKDDANHAANCSREVGDPNAHSVIEQTQKDEDDANRFDADGPDETEEAISRDAQGSQCATVSETLDNSELGNEPFNVNLALDVKPKRRLGKAKAKPSPAPSQTPSEIESADAKTDTSAGAEDTPHQKQIPAEVAPSQQEFLKESIDYGHRNDGSPQRSSKALSRPPRPENSLANQTAATHASSPAATRQGGPSSVASNREGSSAPSDSSRVSFHPSVVDSSMASLDGSGAEDSGASQGPLDVELNVGPKPKRRMSKAKAKVSPKPPRDQTDESLCADDSKDENNVQDASPDKTASAASSGVRHNDLARDASDYDPSSPPVLPNNRENIDTSCCPTEGTSEVAFDMSSEQQISRITTVKTSADPSLVQEQEPSVSQSIGLIDQSSIRDCTFDKSITEPSPELPQHGGSCSALTNAELQVCPDQQISATAAVETSANPLAQALEPASDSLGLIEGNSSRDGSFDKSVKEPSLGSPQQGGSSSSVSESVNDLPNKMEDKHHDTESQKQDSRCLSGLQVDGLDQKLQNHEEGLAAHKEHEDENRPQLVHNDAISSGSKSEPDGVADRKVTDSEAGDHVEGDQRLLEDPLGEVPNVMQRPTVSLIDATSICIEWSPVLCSPPVTGYALAVEESFSESSKTRFYDVQTGSLVASAEDARPVPAEITSVIVACLIKGSHCRAQVWAVNVAGNGECSPFSDSVLLKWTRVPSKPPAPTMQIIDSTHMRISWAPLKQTPPVLGYAVAVQELFGPLGYYDQRSGMLLSNSAGIPPLPRHVNTVVIGGLAIGMEYVAVIAAANEVGWSEFSESSETVVIDVPGVLAQPSVELIDHARAKISWIAPPASQAVTGYSICIAQDKGQRYYDFRNGCLVDDPAVAQPVPAATTSLIIDKLFACVRYRVRMAALNSIGWSGYSSFGNTFIINVPSKPSPPKVEPVNGRSIRVSWSHVKHVPQVVAYAVAVQSEANVEHYDTQSGRLTEKFESSCLIPAHRSSIVVTGLLCRKPYRAMVAARNAIGFCNYSSVSDLVTIDVPQKPAHPPALEVIDDTSICVSWALGSAHAIAYSVAVVQSDRHQLTPSARSREAPLKYYDVKTNMLTAEIDGLSPIPAGTTSIVIGGLSLGIGYQAKVAVKNGIGWSRYSAFSDRVVISEPDVPQQPVVKVVDGSSIHVSWMPVRCLPGRIGYAVSVYDGHSCTRRHLDSKTGYLVMSCHDADLLPPESRSAIVKGLTSGVRYKVQVAVINSVGYSHYSSYSEELLLAETEEMRLWPPLPIDLAPGVPRPRTLASSCYRSMCTQSLGNVPCQQLIDIVQDSIESILRLQNRKDLECYHRLRADGHSVVDAAVKLWAGNAEQESWDTHSSTLFVALNRILLKDVDEDLTPWMCVIEAAINHITRPISIACSPIDGSLTAWRGSQLTRRQATDLRAGEIICPPMFVATSMSKQVAAVFQSLYLIELQIPLECSHRGFIQREDCAADTGMLVLVPYAPIEIVEVGQDDIIKAKVLAQLDDAHTESVRCFPI